MDGEQLLKMVEKRAAKEARAAGIKVDSYGSVLLISSLLF